MKYNKKSVEMKFNLAHTLKKAGIEISQIAEVVKRKEATVKLWLSYPDYNSFSSRRLFKKQPKKHLFHQREYTELTSHILDDIAKRVKNIEEIVTHQASQPVFD